MPIGIHLTILPDTEEEAVKAVEVLSRASTGLAFEGITVSMSMGQYTPEEDN